MSMNPIDAVGTDFPFATATPENVEATKKQQEQIANEGLALFINASLPATEESNPDASSLITE